MDAKVTSFGYTRPAFSDTPISIRVELQVEDNAKEMTALDEEKKDEVAVR